MSVVDALVGALPPGSVVVDPDIVEGYRYDRAMTVVPGKPVAVVRPSSTAEVAACVRIVAEHRVPLVTRGAGTGLAGGATAVDGCVTLSTERMRAGTRAFLTTLAEHPEYAQTLLVEIIAAGPLAAQRRDQVLQAFADLLIRENAAAASRGLIARFASPHDAFAIVGAVAELISRQVRLGVVRVCVELRAELAHNFTNAC